MSMQNGGLIGGAKGWNGTVTAQPSKSMGKPWAFIQSSLRMLSFRIRPNPRSSKNFGNFIPLPQKILGLFNHYPTYQVFDLCKSGLGPRKAMGHRKTLQSTGFWVSMFHLTNNLGFSRLPRIFDPYVSSLRENDRKPLNQPKPLNH